MPARITFHPTAAFSEGAIAVDSFCQRARSAAESTSQSVGSSCQRTRCAAARGARERSRRDTPDSRAGERRLFGMSPRLVAQAALLTGALRYPAGSPVQGCGSACASRDQPQAAPAPPARPRQHGFGITQLPPEFLALQRHRDTLGVIDRSALIGGDREFRHSRKRTSIRQSYARRASVRQETSSIERVGLDDVRDSINAAFSASRI